MTPEDKAKLAAAMLQPIRCGGWEYLAKTMDLKTTQGLLARMTKGCCEANLRLDLEPWQVDLIKARIAEAL